MKFNMEENREWRIGNGKQRDPGRKWKKWLACTGKDSKLRYNHLWLTDFSVGVCIFFNPYV